MGSVESGPGSFASALGREGRSAVQTKWAAVCSLRAQWVCFARPRWQRAFGLLAALFRPDGLSYAMVVIQMKIHFFF